MQDPERLREIESLGQEEAEEDQNLEWELPEKTGSWSGAPLLQAVVCAIALGILLILKFVDTGRYQEFTSWYKGEMAQEIELPQLERIMPEAEPSPAPQPTPSEAPSIQTGNAPLEML